MAATILGFLPWLIVAAGCWLGYQLVQQNGRILIQLEAINTRLTQLSAAGLPAAHSDHAEPAGLPVGSQAPAFELPTLNGGRITLEQFRGRQLLLTFFSPSCGFCQQMAPQLAELPVDAANGHPLPVVISTGDPEANRKLFEQHHITAPVALQKEMEVASRYQVNGTPMGYLVDREGRIASPVAVGAQALLQLARNPAPTLPQATLQPSSNGHRVYPGNKPLSESHLDRNGLQPGTPAPEFRLPKVGGGEASLSDYRGRPVLLVFSDPGCGPCMQLAPQLEKLQKQRRDLQVVAVSRGDVDANQAKVKEDRLTYPILLQRHWEISKEYAMFGTPIAYLIDERGVIAAPPASGLAAIMALAAGREEDRY